MKLGVAPLASILALAPGRLGAQVADSAGATWAAKTVQHIRPYIVYPARLKDSGRAFRAVVRFKVDRDGRVSGSTILESSGTREIDAATLRAIRRVSPLPPPPITDEPTLSIVLPIAFEPRRK